MFGRGGTGRASGGRRTPRATAALALSAVLLGVVASGDGAVTAAAAPEPAPEPAPWVASEDLPRASGSESFGPPVQPLAYAHKGVTIDAVRNTPPALRAAFANGADGVEFDVVKTKSGQLVVLSDTNLAASTTCTGSTEDWDYFQLRQRCRTPDGARIPTLDEALAVVRDNGGKAMVHVKIHPDRAAAARIVKALNKSGLNRDGKATVFAFHPPMLELLRAAGAARLGLIFNDSTAKHWKTRTYHALIPYNTPITQQLVRDAQADGVAVYPVETYGTHPFTVAQGVALGVDGMILDSLPVAPRA